jgi:hypothetical protein
VKNESGVNEQQGQWGRKESNVEYSLSQSEADLEQSNSEGNVVEAANRKIRGGQ